MASWNINYSHNPPYFATSTTQVDAKHTVTEMTTCQHLQSKNKPFLFVSFLTYATSDYHHSAIQKVSKLEKKKSEQYLRAY